MYAYFVRKFLIKKIKRICNFFIILAVAIICIIYYFTILFLILFFVGYSVKIFIYFLGESDIFNSSPFQLDHFTYGIYGTLFLFVSYKFIKKNRRDNLELETPQDIKYRVIDF